LELVVVEHKALALLLLMVQIQFFHQSLLLAVDWEE
jgi:hypothetical protein